MCGLASVYPYHPSASPVEQRELLAIREAMRSRGPDGSGEWLSPDGRVGLKVALSGLGGDELLGGYPSFRDVPRWHRLARVPSRIPGLARLARGLIQAAASGLARRLPKLPAAFGHARSFGGAWMLRRALFLPHELPALLGPELAREGLRRLDFGARTRALLAHGPAAVPSRVSLLEASLYMRNQLLRDADWASMAHSLEVRVPFVDASLWSTVHPLSAERAGKGDFARALGLPAAVVDRPKTGFTTPVGSWIARTAQGDPQGPLARRWARDVVAASSHADDAARLKNAPAGQSILEAV